MRSPLSITLSVWRAIFLREALDRLFRERAAWFWLLLEPVLYIMFIAFIWLALRAHTIGGIDIAVWVMVGMLAYFLFRRTAIQVMYAAECNRAYFAYRQVKPFDTAIVRGALEAFLMGIVAFIVLNAALLLGHDAIPQDPLGVISAAFGLWLLGLGYGLVASVIMVLVPELEHILNLFMLPMYLISGVIYPVASVPPPYRDLLMINPVAHALEAVRQGYVPHYHAVDGVSLFYLYAWAAVAVLFGMLLYRRFALRLVMQ
ncbi:MAG: ABC transporter permease [Rhodocyclaceae bacterium]|nr:ABC transporter permease [Rhodocyclaceae bacterium]